MEKKNIAIITGASGGLGREFIKLLSAEQDVQEIWAIARNESKLQRTAGEFGQKIIPFPLDLTNRESWNKVAVRLAEENARVRWLVNNAGFAKFCSYDEISLDESIAMIDLNISAVVALGLVCLRHMERGDHIVNIASQASFQPLPYQNIYSSTKSFVRNYTRALNVELKERGICATAVCPGWMKTDLLTVGDVGAKKCVHNFKGLASPAAVASRAIKDAKKNKDISVYGAYVKTAHAVAHFLPQKSMMRLWLKQQKIK